MAAHTPAKPNDAPPATGGLLHWLTRPHPHLMSESDRLSSRLLSQILLVALAAASLLMAHDQLIRRPGLDPDELAVLGGMVLGFIAYLLNWNGHYRTATLLFNGIVLVLFSVLPFLLEDPSLASFIPVSVMLASMFFNFRLMLLTGVVSVTLPFILLYVSGLSQDGHFMLPVYAAMFIAALVLTQTRHANQLAQLQRKALEEANARLRESEASLEARVQRRTRDIRLAIEVAQEMSSELDLDRLLPNVAERIRDAFGLYHASIFLYDSASNTVAFKAGTGQAGERMEKERRRFNLSEDMGVVPQAARKQTPVLVNDISRSVLHVPNPVLPHTRSELALPMLYGGKLIGVLDVQSEQVDGFSESDVRLMRSLADQIAIAERNARSFEAEKRSREEMMQFFVVAERLNAASSYTEILEAFADVFADLNMDISLNIYERFNLDEASYVEVVAQQQAGATEATWVNQQFPLTEANTPPQMRGIVVIDSVARPPQGLESTAQFIAATGIAAMMSRSLTYRGRTVGTITFTSVDGPRSLDEDVQRTLTGISEMVAASIERIRLYDEQVRIADELRAIDQMKSQFLASMSHELRTPLNAVLNFTRFVAMGMLGEVNSKQVDALNKAIDSGKHLLDLINDVLDITKIEAGMMTLFVEQDVDLNTELATVLETAHVLIGDKPITLVQDIDQNLPVIVGDKRRIRQILLNLVSNAAKFTEQGSITVSAKCRTDEVFFAVIDTGPGIAPEDVDLIFEPFQQTEAGIVHANGTGLGLPISRKLAEAHGGALWLESEPGEGAAFYVSLPIIQESIDREQPVKEVSHAG